MISQQQKFERAKTKVISIYRWPFPPKFNPGSTSVPLPLMRLEIHFHASKLHLTNVDVKVFLSDYPLGRSHCKGIVTKPEFVDYLVSDHLLDRDVEL